MRVLFITHNFPRYDGDAAGSFLLRLALALRDVGIEVRVVAPASAGVAPHDALHAVQVTRFRYAPRAWETLAYTGNMARDVQRSWSGRAALAGMLIAAANAARRETRAWKPDVIHANWWFPMGLAMTMPGAPRDVPLVVTSHGSDIRLARNTRPAHGLLRRVARRADHFTFVSRWLRDEAAKLATLGDTTVAPMPVATELFTPPPAGVVREGVLFVGRLNEQKGVTDLLRAIARQSTHSIANIVGDGPDAGALHALARSLDIADRVRWHPVIDQPALVELYRRARVLAVPSREEGLGLVAAEAMLCGTPVVAYASGGITDIVHDRVNGRLVPVGDVEGFASALDHVVSDAAAARAYGQRGRADALERFSPTAAAERYRDIYELAIRRRGA